MLTLFIILMMRPAGSNSLEILDTQQVPDGAELIPISVSNIQMQEPGNDNNLYNAGNVMPIAMNVDFACQGQRVHLQLQAQERSSDSLNSDNEILEDSTLTVDDFPVFTLSEKSKEVDLDTFPRLFSGMYRKFRDLESLAVFLVFNDPVVGSYKFFGSFAMGGSRYFVQPYALHKSPTNRYHVTSQLPEIDMTSDINGMLFHVTGETDDQNKGVRHPRNVDQEVTGNLLNSFLNINPDVVSTESVGIQNHVLNNSALYPLDASSGYREDARKVHKRHAKKGDTAKNKFSTRNKRQADNRYTVETVIVCDYLCYLRFQTIYGLTDEVMTKNTIALFFSYVQELMDFSYGSVFSLYPQLSTEVIITVPGLVIISSPDVKVIGDYLFGDNFEVDDYPSAYEFAIWVQDNLEGFLTADHYALVTGYDLFGNRAFGPVLGLVTRIGSVCDIDRVSITENLLITLTPSVLTHELGHSLGAFHDSDTNGICQNSDSFIMSASIGGLIPIEYQSNPYRFSPCSATFFSQTLASKQCVQRQDFNTSALPDEISLLGQQFPLEEQCALLFSGSTLCRDVAIQLEGSWDRVCTSRSCVVPFLENVCYEVLSFEYTSCGNRRWCIAGNCVDDPRAPEKPVDCPAGDSPQVSCDVSECTGYNSSTRFVQCCDTCRPIKTERFVLVDDNDI